MTAVNAGLVRYIYNSHKDPRSQPTGILELLSFYGIMMAMENTWGNDVKNMRAHFASVKQRYRAVKKLGWDRFSALLSACTPSFEQLRQICALLNSTAISHVVPFSVSSPLFVEWTSNLQPLGYCCEHG